MVTTQVKIGYGVLLPSIHEQLNAQGLYVINADRFEKMRDAVNLLSMSGMLTDSQKDIVLRKLHKRITKHVRSFTHD